MRFGIVASFPYAFIKLAFYRFAEAPAMKETKESTWNLIIVISIIGLLGQLADLLYHISIGETEEVLGVTLLEKITHPFAFLVLIIIILIGLWQRFGK